jgi:predicted CoA-binding protein
MTTPEREILRRYRTIAVVGASSDPMKPANYVPEYMQAHGYRIIPVNVIDDAIAAGAKVVWTQLGIINEEAATVARAAGLEVVMDRCMKTELRRMIQDGEWSDEH